MSEYKLLLLHKITVLCMNILVLSAVTVAMYLAAQNPEEFTVVFLKVFCGSLIPLLGLGFVAKRLLRKLMLEMVGDAA